MTVPVRIVALAEHLFVPFVRFIRVMETMGCVKMGFSRYVDQFDDIWFVSTLRTQSIAGGFPLLLKINMYKKTPDGLIDFPLFSERIISLLIRFYLE